MNFKDGILIWYEKNKRSLPWREMKDPYKIWVSEIILQQTRVAQGLPYYYKFIEKFPDVVSLANTTEQAILNIWKGLGYYTRARNMHYTARVITDLYNGVFPTDFKTLKSLKGVGEYTAAAISSICSGEKRAVVDGNVVRVLSRYFGIEDPAGTSIILKKIRWISNNLIPDENPGIYNQAVMEYGALHCTPKKPQCGSCLLMKSCFAFNNRITDVLPIKKKTVVKRTRFFTYLHIVTRDDKYILYKRRGNDIWKNLWDFPAIESDRLITHDEIILKNEVPGIDLRGEACFSGFSDTKHILSHQILNVRFLTYIVDGIEIKNEKNIVLTSFEDNNYPIPSLIENFIKKT